MSMTDRDSNSVQPNHHWKNWSGLQHANPSHIATPRNSIDLKTTIQQAQKCRVVGAGHSFSPLVSTNETLISLDLFSGLIRHDASKSQCTLHAGTRLKNLEPLLNPLNQSLINQGDIDQQSLAGAVGTGTHGTGIDLTCLSAFVEGFELITASGETLQCDRQQHSDIFEAGRVALGSLGVMSEITLQNIPRYRLKEQLSLVPVQDIYRSMHQWKNQHRHIECWVFPHARDAMIKTLNPTTEEVQTLSKPWLSDDTLLTWCCELIRSQPWLNIHLQKMLGVMIKPTTRVDWSSRIFPSERNTRFNEMEYQVPAELGLECLAEIIATLQQHNAPVFFPIEYRYVKGDDIWLSPFYQRDSASISIHQYHKQDHREIFKLVEPIFWKYEGRPHWGKLHTLSAAELKPLYPRWDEFMTLRQILDPSQKWINPHLNSLFFG